MPPGPLDPYNNQTDLPGGTNCDEPPGGCEEGYVWNPVLCDCIADPNIPDLDIPGTPGGGPSGGGPGPHSPERGIVGCTDVGAYNYNEKATHPCGLWDYRANTEPIYGPILEDGTDEVVVISGGIENECCVKPDDFESPGGSGLGGGDIFPEVPPIPSDCPDLAEETPSEQPEQTCFPVLDALVPDWLRQPEGKPFFNQRTCEYSVVMFAEPPDCSGEFLDSFIPAAVDRLIEHYNKSETTTFLYSDGREELISSRGALVSGVLGRKREGLEFTFPAEVKTFYISPRPLEKTRVLISVDAEQFNRVPEKEEKFSYAAEVPFGAEPSYVVFYTSEILRIFDAVASNFRFYENQYADWCLETGKIIKGLNLTADANRIEGFYRSLSSLLVESGMTYNGLETLEIGFSPSYKIEYIKAKEPFRPPTLIQVGLTSFIESPENTNATTMAYISRLPDMREEMVRRNPIPWYDILVKYRYPSVEEVYISDITSPLVEGNEGIKKLTELSCPATDAFQPKKSPGEWATVQVNSIRDALTNQLREEPCLLIDGKILEDRNRESLAMQMIDLTLKEYLSSDRIINDLPVMLVDGKWDNIEDLYGGMLNNLGYCGLIDLIKTAMDCLLNALGYEDSVKIITRAAIKGMNKEEFSNLVNSMSPAMQELVVATVSETAPQLLPFLQSLVTIRIVDEQGIEIEAVEDRTLAYSYSSAGKYTRLQGASTTTPVFFSQAANIDYPPPSAEDYATLNEVVVGLLMEDLLGVDEMLDLLDKLPGAAIAISVIEKMDKFCAAPPRFYPPLSDVLGLPGINIDICELKDGITFLPPTFQAPRLTLAGFGNVVLDNALLVIKELARSLLILVLRRILEIIFEELCKQRVNTDPTGLRELMAAGCSGDMDPMDLDQALADIADTLNCFSDAEALGRFIDNISSVLTECELVDLIKGEASDNIYDLVYRIIQLDPLTSSLSECLNDKDSITDFFKTIGIFIDLDMLCSVDPLDLPFSQEVCDDLGLLALFRDTRAQALRDKGVDEECIAGQLCQLRDKTIADLEDLTGMLHSGVLDSLMPNITKDPKNPDEPSILPAIDPATAITINSAFDSMFDTLAVQYTEDLIGRRGFFNMCLADSRGRGLTQHLGLQRSILGPSVFNIYGSRGTRTYPPRDEWGQNWDAGKIQDHNDWVDGPMQHTEDAANFFWLPFIFNPLSADGTKPEAEGDADQEVNGGTETHGRPPAVGGLPDKVAGYLQEQLVALPVDFDKDNAYSVILPWKEYGGEDSEIDINLFYDCHGPNPDGRAAYEYDPYRIKLQMTMDYGKGKSTDTKAYFVTDDQIQPEVSAYMRDFVVSRTSAEVTTPSEMWGAFVEKIVTDASENPSAVGVTNLYEHFSKGVFNKVSAGLIDMLAEDISRIDIFDYGFDFESAPEIVFFHEDKDGEYDGNLAAAIERYGGSESNPPFYLSQPKEKGFLRLANSIVPEFNPCEDQQVKAKFPNFTELKHVANGLVERYGNDERLSRSAGDVINVIEAPFERVLPAVALALNESLISTTIRIYLSEFMLKAIPAFYFLKPGYPDNYTNMISEYIIEVMEKGLIAAGRGRSFREDHKDYYYLFLEQVVQAFSTKIEYGVLTDVTEIESEALKRIYSFVENNWAGYVSPKSIGAPEARKLKLENWRNILSQDSVKKDCKVILRRYVGEELTRMGSLLGDSLPTEDPYPIKSVDDILLTSPKRIATPLTIPGGTVMIGVPYMAGAVNSQSDGGPIDVPTLDYYTTYGIGGGGSHPLDDIQFDDRNWPFVLERYVTYRGNDITHLYGRVANLFDWENLPNGETGYSTFANQLYFGLRLSYVPGNSDRSAVNFAEIESTMREEVSFSEKAHAEIYKHLIPLVAVEIQANKTREHGNIYSATDYQYYLQDLICELIKTPEYKMTFKYVFPVARYMSMLAIYVANTFVPSLAQLSDGWASTIGPEKKGGGQWIGLGKFGGMRTWRGNEGTENSFGQAKGVARQLLESSCNTNYFYQDRDHLSPPEAYIDVTRPKNDTGFKIKWWQWSSLRPAPCKKDD